MTTHNNTQPRFSRRDLEMIMIVLRREVRDSFRDWRIIVPILLLTLAFPALTSFAAQRMVHFVSQYGERNQIIVRQLVPFLLLVVGFLPMSFSLVIALETFVGEKERKSLEPLLSTPLTNLQLYLGKMIAAVLPPLAASYLGMAVYLVGLRLAMGWAPDLMLFIQIVTISTVQGVLMVAAAVVVSSQTTSVRASNLMASFIIVPMALLVQFEAVVMFWGNNRGLWWVILGLMVTTAIFLRMGIKLFNREELLGRQLDQLRVKWMWQVFWDAFSGRDKEGRYPSPRRWYRQSRTLLPQLRIPTLVLMLSLIGSIGVGVILTRQYQLPPSMQADLVAQISSETISERIPFVSSMASQLPLKIFRQNFRVLLLSTVLGMFTFGVLGIAIFALPWAPISYIVTQIAIAGGDAPTFVMGTILPHALFELPALLIASAAALRWHAVIIAPPPNKTISETWLTAGGEFGRLFLGYALPLLLLAAYVEAYLTPVILSYLYS